MSERPAIEPGDVVAYKDGFGEWSTSIAVSVNPDGGTVTLYSVHPYDYHGVVMQREAVRFVGRSPVVSIEQGRLVLSAAVPSEDLE